MELSRCRRRHPHGGPPPPPAAPPGSERSVHPRAATAVRPCPPPHLRVACMVGASAAAAWPALPAGPCSRRSAWSLPVSHAGAGTPAPPRRRPGGSVRRALALDRGARVGSPSLSAVPPVREPCACTWPVHGSECLLVHGVTGVPGWLGDRLPFALWLDRGALIGARRGAPPRGAHRSRACTSRAAACLVGLHPSPWPDTHLSLPACALRCWNRERHRPAAALVPLCSGPQRKDLSD